MDTVKGLIQKFRRDGLKVTPQRIAIFRDMYGNRNHPSVEDIHQALSPDYPTMSLTTIYKTLETLRDMGEVLELNLFRERILYDPETRPHHHAICDNCGRILDIFHDLSQILHAMEAHPSSFKPSGFQIIFNGLCSKCNKGN